eukprot:m.34162 g.34162  ORF g.34162 m.34162 type:complete len:114 (-) comp15405_c0_seq2:38-379(-)
MTENGGCTVYPKNRIGPRLSDFQILQNKIFDQEVQYMTNQIRLIKEGKHAQLTEQLQRLEKNQVDQKQATDDLYQIQLDEINNECQEQIEALKADCAVSYFVVSRSKNTSDNK